MPITPARRSSLRRRLIRPGAAVVALSISVWLTGAFFASSAQASAGGSLTAQHAIAKHITPVRGTAHGNGGGKPGGGGGGHKTTSNGINYHGGPVLLGTTDMYYIWYGDWSANTKAQTLLTTLGDNIGGTPWYNIQTTYYDGNGNTISNAVKLAGQTSVAYPYGKSLTDANIASIVQDAIGNTLPNDPNGVYFVLTSGDVTETSGFLTKYCGWHTYGTTDNVQYSFVGDPSANMSACSVQSTSPNGDAVADAMASVIAHELVESASDPQLNAWYDNRGYENADKCAWTFGTTSTASNGSSYNMSFGGTEWLIQQNWVNASGGYCAVSY